jgi:hypothetical protein
VIDNPDEVFEVAPDCCARCEKSLAGGQEASRIRRQVVDASPPPPPTVTEYQLVSRRCGGCGHVSEPTATDVPRPLVHGTIPIPDTTTPAETGAGDRAKRTVLPVFIRGWGWRRRPGSPVRIGSRTQALAVLLTCGHYLPIGRARSVLDTVAGVRVSTGSPPVSAGEPRSCSTPGSCPICGHCYPPRRCSTPMRPPVARLAGVCACGVHFDVDARRWPHVCEHRRRWSAPAVHRDPHA